MSQSRDLLDYIIFIVALINIFIMIFYILIKAVIPPISFLKDMFLLSALGLSILSVISNKGKLYSLNIIDILVGTLFIYLFFHFFYTIDKVDNIGVAYYGFRLQFISISLYFLFKNIKVAKHKEIIHRTISTCLVFGCMFTLLEVLIVNLGILSIDEYLGLMKRGFLNDGNWMTSGFSWPRVMGLCGTPQTTGVYNAILFGIILYSPTVTREILPTYRILPSIKQKILDRKISLILLSFISVAVSTSKTAWTISLLIMLLYVFTYQKIKLGRIIFIFISITSIIFFLINFQSEQIFESYLSFISRYGIIAYNKTIEVISKSPIIGFGYEVGAYSSLLDISNIPKENLVITTELFLARIFRMLGIIGLVYYLVIFLVYPLKLIISPKLQNLQVYSIPILIIGISFGHYSAFEAPPLCVCAWYYLSLISDELSMEKK